jgi:hypothetical protein
MGWSDPFNDRKMHRRESNIRAKRNGTRANTSRAVLANNIPEDIPIEEDLGFQGLQNKFDNIHLPRKKLRGKKLSEQQKEENRELSQERVKCEHAYAEINRYGSIVTVYRNRVPGFDGHLTLVAAGLWNWYLEVA